MDYLEAFFQQMSVEPRRYQQRIIRQAVEHYQKGLRSILIESPTGSGKTVMGLLVAASMQQQLGIKVGWVAMRRNLLAQAAATVREHQIPLEAHWISMFEKDPPCNLDLLIVDEAQHDAANSMAHLHSRIQPKYILGLSATPYRADKVKLCFDTVIRDAGIQQLMQDGYLSTYHHYTIPEYTPKSLAQLYSSDPARWGKSVAFFHQIEQCYSAQRLLQQAGINCDVVTGSSNREEQLDAFEAGKTDVLLNCMVLAEGFDCPTLQTVFCRPSGKGTTIQMAGRVFRKHPQVPLKQVVQCKKTRWPIVRTASAELQYIWHEEGWRTLDVNPHIQQVGLQMMHALAQTEITLPEYLNKKRSTRPQFWSESADMQQESL
ncbi:MAG: DEAD/DEAH box helicase family protein [Zavarzinella sp.]